MRREGECRATLSHIYPHYPIYVHIIPHMALHSLHMTGLAIPLARGLGISTLSHICPHYPTYGLTYDRARHSVCTRFRPLAFTYGRIIPHMSTLSHIWQGSPFRLHADDGALFLPGVSVGGYFFFFLVSVLGAAALVCALLSLAW